LRGKRSEHSQQQLLFRRLHSREMACRLV
jgi:hypothetical protein